LASRRSIGHVGVRLPVAALLLFLLPLGGCEKEEPKVAPPPVEVAVVTVTPKTVPVTMTFVAQTESSHQVEVVARVSGFLEKIAYREGDLVQKGQVLFQMDRKPFQAQVAGAKGELERAKAQLWTARANLNRIQPLAKLDAASQSDLDNATGAVQSAGAAVYQAQARLDEAELNLGYTIIHAPVTGLSSRSLVREGAFLNPMGETARLTYVAQVNPIWINFSVSQNEFARMQDEVAKGILVPPPNQSYQVEIKLPDGSRYPYPGKISFADPSFSRETGTFLVRAELPNQQAMLRPGMFVTAIVSGAVRPNAIAIPQKAVQETPNGHVVYGVNEQGLADQRPVVVGEWIGDDWVIRQGLKAGDKVIVDGFQRLTPGAPVKAVAAEATPAAPAEGSSAPPPAEK
jgi:membrane fusion protein (multidrug efflux system)